MIRRLDIRGQLPSTGAARYAVIASLVVGGVVATGLTVLIAVFVATALRN